MVGKGEGKTRSSSKKDEEKKEIQVKLTRTKSPARKDLNKSPKKTRQRSPGRPPKNDKSPVRVRSDKSKSPARTLNNEKRRSPGRPRTIIKNSPDWSPNRLTSTSKKSTKSPTRRSPIKKSPAGIIESEKATKKPITISLDSESDSEYETKSEHSKSSYKARLRKTPTKEGSIESLTNVIRRSSRLNQYERVVHLKSNYEPIAKLNEFSDEDEFQIKKPELAQDSKIEKNYAALFGALFHIIFASSLFFGLLILCNDMECSFKIPKLARFANFETYFDLPVFLSFTAYLLFIAILSSLPFGGKKCVGMLNKSGKLTYVMNGLFSAFVVLAILTTLESYQVNVTSYILVNFLKLAVSGFLLALPLAILLHIKSFYVPISHLNTSATKNSGFLNFVYGSEVNPRLFGILDFKMMLFRSCIISMLIITSACLYQSLETIDKTPDVETSLIDGIQSLRVNPTILVLCTMFIVYLIDGLLFEYAMLSTQEIKYESLGYLKCLEYLSATAWYALIPKYLLDYNVQLENWQLVSSSVVFVIGYVLYRGSNSQKHAFRENPYSPVVSHLESIPTGSGKRLICSGYWGFVRHPNYLGDILIHLSFLPFVLCNPPCIIVYFNILNLMHRAQRDNKRCKDHYGTAWDRYCQRVKYILIPKVY